MPAGSLKRLGRVITGRNGLNILGLTAAIALALMIFKALEFETSFDAFHPHANRIFRFVTQLTTGSSTHYTSGVPEPFPTAFKNDYPKWGKVAALLNIDGTEVQALGNGKSVNSDQPAFAEKGIFLTTPGFFDIFYSKWLTGDKSVLAKPGMVVLTKSIAEKYFGSWEGAPGRYLKLANHVPVKVAGVIEDYPLNSDIPIKIIVSYATLRPNIDYLDVISLNNWGAWSTQYQTFISLSPQITAGSVDLLLRNFTDKYFQKDANLKRTVYLQPLSDMHFNPKFSIFGDQTVDKATLWTVGLIGAFILLMAIINFVNLATAQAISRSKEIGVRKVLGCNRSRIIARLLGETSFLVFLSIILASIFSVSAHPLLSRIFDIPESIPLFTGSTVVFLILCQLSITLLAGLYPALELSRFNPLPALKSQINTSTIGGASVRWGLIVLQFVSLQILFIGSLVVIAQMNFVQHTDLGFNKDSILQIPLPNDNNDSAKLARMDALKNQLLQLPSVLRATYASAAPSSNGNNWETSFSFDNSPKPAGFNVYFKSLDADYFKIFELQFLAGNGFYPDETDHGIVINETLRKKLNLPNPQSAIGKNIKFGNGSWHPIIGVTRDFMTKSLRDSIRPMVLVNAPSFYKLIDIKVATGDLKATLSKMRDVWQASFPGRPFDYAFLDDTIAHYYKQETQLALLSKLLTLVAICISCLGLFALVSFMAVRRIKEMSVRKVLGASMINIAYLFSREFTILVGISFLIAAPSAYLLMKNWLLHFTFRVEINSGIFVLTIMGSLAIAWLTIGYHVVRVALVNPAKTLRTE